MLYHAYDGHNKCGEEQWLLLENCEIMDLANQSSKLFILLIIIIFAWSKQQASWKPMVLYFADTIPMFRGKLLQNKDYGAKSKLDKKYRSVFL